MHIKRQSVRMNILKKTIFKKLKNQNGQSLVEYLLILALMGVATIGVVRVLSQSVSIKFARITHAIQGTHKKMDTPQVKSYHIKKKDMSDFFDGVSSHKE